jgi:DNA adenine methylase
LLSNPAIAAKPFLKWAGGKSQLLLQLAAHFPPELAAGKLPRYVEPFLGSGALFLHLAQHYPIRSAYLTDANPELILVFRVVQQAPAALTDRLLEHQQRYALLDAAQRTGYFYRIRDDYNAQRAHIDFDRYSHAWVDRAAQMIFLNKTGYNGLYRVNGRGHFNVPHGRYKNPALVDPSNLQQVSALLQRAEVHRMPYTDCARWVDSDTFVYFDPPYRPLSRTANFTSYSKESFGDHEQAQLARFFAQLHDQQAPRLMLSNSDPLNCEPPDHFFEQHYGRFHMHRVWASRAINSNAAKRGKITELLITNY